MMNNEREGLGKSEARGRMGVCGNSVLLFIFLDQLQDPNIVGDSAMQVRFISPRLQTVNPCRWCQSTDHSEWKLLVYIFIEVMVLFCMFFYSNYV